MGFWSDFSTSEPQRQNRWFMYFADEGLQNNVYALKECAKPSYKVETTQHLLINHTFNYPKNVIWQPIAVKMVSVAGTGELDSLPEIFTSRLSKTGYRIPTGLVKNVMGKETMSFPNNGVHIIQIDESGNQIEDWRLHNAMVTDVNFGNLSYASEDLVEISFTLVYDYAYIHHTLPEALKEIRTAPRPIALGGEADGRNVLINGRRGF